MSWLPLLIVHLLRHENQRPVRFHLIERPGHRGPRHSHHPSDVANRMASGSQFLGSRDILVCQPLRSTPMPTPTLKLLACRRYSLRNALLRFLLSGLEPVGVTALVSVVELAHDSDARPWGP